MNKTTDQHYRYHPYHQSKTHKNHRYDEHEASDYKRHYKKNTSQYQSSYAHDDRSYRDYSSRHDHRSPHQSSRSKRYSSFSTPPPSLLSLPLLPPPVIEPALAPPSLTVVPHQRESWVRSVKKTKNNESTEQKTQYLETMLRMPQQAKSTLNSSRFDRMRFADDQSAAATTANLADGSFHLVDDIQGHDEIRTLEKILFDNDLNDSPPVTSKSVTSGFLIDNCDEEELPPLPSPSPAPPLPPPSEESPAPVDEKVVNEQRVLLVNELDTAEAEEREESKRQKRLQQKLKKKKKKKDATHAAAAAEESSADWMIEYDIPALDTTLTDEDRTERVNLILMKIKKQQDELRKLRQYVMSMLGEQPKRTTTTTTATQPSSSLSPELLLALLNQSNQNGCWLCSGKLYSEVATQCDEPTTQ